VACHLLAGGLIHIVGNAVAVALAERAHDDSRTVTDEMLCNGATDTSGAARDDCDSMTWLHWRFETRHVHLKFYCRSPKALSGKESSGGRQTWRPA
jgi:hypothetical protein